MGSTQLSPCVWGGRARVGGSGGREKPLVLELIPAFPGMSPGSGPWWTPASLPALAPRSEWQGSVSSLCQLCESALSWGWWLPASPLEARLFRAFAACLQFQGGKDGGQAGEEGRASVPLLPPGVSEANFSFPASAAHCWWNGPVKLA